MRPLSTTELLDAWDRCASQPPAQMALTFLGAACPGVSSESLAELTVGQRDAQLLKLREWAFGSKLTGLAECPACGERVESAFQTEELLATAATSTPLEQEVSREGYAVSFRLPNSADLLAMEREPDTATIEDRLLARCVIRAQRAGDDVPAATLPGAVVQAISEAMDAADPQANIQLAMVCPSCGHHWDAAFDIGSFFWDELNAWAGRVLREVHLLASAYGWTETEVFALSPSRRQIYLEMVGA